MKNTMIFITLAVFAFAASDVSAQTRFCFENASLKSANRISFELEGSKIVEGYFEVIGDNPDTSAETFNFSGTKNGNVLKINFSGTIPYERPPKTKSVVWTIGKNALKVPTYGKNYETNKFSVYTATYEKCAGILIAEI